MDIRCRKTDCKHNDKYTCRAKQIKITKNDSCCSYKQGKKANIEASQELFKGKKLFSKHRDTKNMEISCDNDCILKHKGKCRANGVTINDLDGKPCCMTYLKK